MSDGKMSDGNQDHRGQVKKYRLRMNIGTSLVLLGAILGMALFSIHPVLPALAGVAAGGVGSTYNAATKIIKIHEARILELETQTDPAS